MFILLFLFVDLTDEERRLLDKIRLRKEQLIEDIKVSESIAFYLF